MEILMLKLKQRQGSVMIDSALACFIGIMLLAVCLEVGRTYLTISMIERKTDAAVHSVATTNVANIYDGVRESTGNARSVSNGTWSALVSTEEVENALVNTLMLTDSGDNLDKITTESNTAYRITNLRTVYINSDGSNLNFKTTMTVTIPLNFLGLNINQDLGVNTTYDARF